MGALHLTFDDGPHPVWTPAVLDELAAHGARASFFVMALAAREQPALVARMVGAGHAVELHAWRHRRHSGLDRIDIDRDAARGLRALAGVGVSPHRWRTPSGRLGPATREVAERHGLTLTGWTADTHDRRGDPAQAMVRVLAPGAIVLAHDGLGPGAPRRSAVETVRFVGLAAAWAEERGLALEPLPVPGAGPAGGDVPAGGPAAASSASR